MISIVIALITIARSLLQRHIRVHVHGDAHAGPQHDAAKHYTACERARGLNYSLSESFR